MKIALAGWDSRDGAILSQMKRTLDTLNVDTQVMKDGNYKPAKEADIVLLAGGDRSILDYFHKVESDSAPVLGVYESDSTGFLAQIDIRDLEMATLRLKKSDYEIDEVFRLAVKVDGREVEPVLNDV